MNKHFVLFNQIKFCIRQMNSVKSSIHCVALHTVCIYTALQKKVNSDVMQKMAATMYV